MSEKPEPKRQRDSIHVPKDRFDAVSHGGRVGAHRLKPRPRVLWKYLILGLVSFVVFAGLGIVALQMVSGSSSSVKAEEQKKAEPVKSSAKLDPSATVVVLNATDLSQLGSKVSTYITEKKLGTVVLDDQAAQAAQISAVFYKDAADESAATALGERLGGVSAYLTTEYENMSARLVLLLAADYNGPGKKAAQKAAKEEAAQDAAGETAGTESAETGGTAADAAAG